MRYWIRGLVLISIMILSACAKDKLPPETPYTVRENLDRPEIGNWDFRPEKLWRSSPEVDRRLALVQDLVISDSGGIFVLDAKQFKIHILDSKGKWIRSFGKKGEGPGEIRHLGKGIQLHIHNNRIIIIDLGKFHFYSLQGEFIEDIPYPAHLWPRAFIGESRYVAGPYIADNREQKLTLNQFQQRSGTILVQYSSFPEARGKPKKSRPIIADGITPMMIVASRNLQIYHGINSRMEINVRNELGSKILVFSIPKRPKLPVPKSFIDHLKRIFSDLPPEKTKSLLKALPGDTCFFDRIFVDRNGFVYVFNVNLEENHQRQCDIFDARGNYRFRALLEAEEGYSIKEFQMHDNQLVMALMDMEGNYMLEKYRLALPE